MNLRYSLKTWINYDPEMSGEGTRRERGYPGRKKMGCCSIAAHAVTGRQRFSCTQPYYLSNILCNTRHLAVFRVATALDYPEIKIQAHSIVAEEYEV